MLFPYADHHPVSIGYNICYIVAAIIIKDKHVLMMRESKKSVMANGTFQQVEWKRMKQWRYLI